MPANTYSGGRYYALMLAEAMAAGGNEVYFVTNQLPVFFRDMEHFPAHSRIGICITNDFKSNLPKGSFDAVFLVPAAGLAGYYARAELFAIERGAHLVFVNFESGDWFNSLSPSKRPLSDWTPWRRAVRFASLVLSISQEGNLWARAFYRGRWRLTKFGVCYPPINTPAADSLPEVKREQRVLLFMRFSTSKHKGSESLDQLFCESLRGYTMVFVLGKEDVPADILQRLTSHSRKYGVTLEFLRQLSDREKFREIKRSRLVLFPSLFEGYGYPPVEALYCGTPCVAFRLPVLEETCGTKLHYAAHGNWDDFREQIQVALRSLDDEASLRDQVDAIAPLQTATNSLETLLSELPAMDDLASKLRAIRRSYLQFLERMRLTDLRLRLRAKRRRLRDRVVDVAGRVVRKIRARSRRHRVSYFPAFETSNELENHWYRAKWYLPFVEGTCEHVAFPVRGSATVGSAPDYMFDCPAPKNHLHVLRGRLRHMADLILSDLVLVWRKDTNSKLLTTIARVCQIPVVNVATEDLGAKEYGAYCSLIWKHLTPSLDRSVRLSAHQQRFHALATRLRTEKYDCACVFGTGPSLERALDFEYGHAINIVCNSIVQNDILMNQLAPTFVCAGDVVSHLGVSRYAHRFREDLIRVLRERETFFVTTADFGSLFLYHFPELEHKTFLLEQTSDYPNFDLTRHYGAPRLDSTLNIHMLPLAATFADEIWLLGCDGKSSERSNEDFWAHARDAQYFDLVDTGHRCHPTFDVHRQMSTYERFVRSTAETVAGGESRHGKRYLALKPSNIPALKTRSIDQQLLDRIAGPPYKLDDLRRAVRLDAEHRSQIPSRVRDEALPTRMGISKCVIYRRNILHVSGWVLSSLVPDRVEVIHDGQVVGLANLGVVRKDIAQKFPEYGQSDCGFQYFGPLNGYGRPNRSVVLKVYATDELIHETTASVV